ncbi:MAG: hypothetical protein ACK4HC_02125 [Cloacibacterium sp.]
MENNKFNEFYSKKSVEELIEQLRTHRISGNFLDKEWYEALKKHLSERDISDEEKAIVEHILLTEPEILEKQKFEKKLINTTKNHKPTSFSIDKYPALKTISKIYEIFAWIIVLITLIITIISIKDSFLLGLGILIAGGIIALGLFAIAESIKVFVDIEYNTRQKK